MRDGASANHLGERLSALIDGELGHDERDRVLVHLAGCARCRAEAEALRAVKRRLAELGDVMPSEGLMRRLRAMGEPGDPLPPPVRPLPGQARAGSAARPRDAWPADRVRPGDRVRQADERVRPGDRARPAGERVRPAGRRPGASGRGRSGRRRLPRGRYLVAGAATLVVLGVGTAAFAAGSDPRSLPRVAPSVEQFAVEHALTSGDIPLTDPRPAETINERP